MENHDVENLDRNNSSSVKTELVRLFECSLSLRASYLLRRRDEPQRQPFSPEDLAQFLILLIITNFAGVGYVPPIPEIVIRFLTGRAAGSNNAVAATVKASFYDRHAISESISWKEFYYLHFLPAKKLLHLTGSREKAQAAALCARRITQVKAELSDCSSTKSSMHHVSPLFNFQSEQGMSSFLSLRNITSSDDRPFSVTILGFHRAMMGLGEDARRMFDMLTELGFRVELYDCSLPSLERDPTADFYELFETGFPCSEVAIFCMPLFEMARIFPNLTEDFYKHRYVVGYWPWELSSFPNGWHELLDLADEIWGSSEFLVQTYKNACKKPVYHVPLCIDIGTCRGDDLPPTINTTDSISFLTVFDFNSTVQRKNPIGSVIAFKMAFADTSLNVRLVLKSLHAKSNPRQLDLLHEAIGSDGRITLIDGPISRESLNSLIAGSTSFLSLHRSEGFGRLLTEAMLLRTPVIATGWSGSSDYVNDRTAFPVDFRLRDVGRTEYPHASGKWAEPDLEHASSIMRDIALGNVDHKAIAENAFLFVSAQFSAKKIKEVLSRRMEAIASNLH